MYKLIRNFFEIRFFGVSEWWSSKIGVKASYIRLFFIYAAFANVLTIFFYLSMVFTLRIRMIFKYKKRRSVFDL